MQDTRIAVIMKIKNRSKIQFNIVIELRWTQTQIRLILYIILCCIISNIYKTKWVKIKIPIKY